MKLTITNQDHEKITVELKIPHHPKGLSFVIHGLGGYKEHPLITAVAQTFFNKNYITVTWDARKTSGESEGDLLDATLSNYYQDLETVINWAKQQKWYQEPFVLGGHSLGAACAVLFADKHSQLVKSLALCSLFTSGKNFEEKFEPVEFDQWKQNKIREWESSSHPGYLKRLKWDFMIDAYKYDLLNNAANLRLPVLMMIGSEDKVTFPDFQRKFFQLVPAQNKKLHVVKGADHSFSGEEYLAEVRTVISGWLDGPG